MRCSNETLFLKLRKFRNAAKGRFNGAGWTHPASRSALRGEIDSLRELLILLNEEISLAGMTIDQQEVNDYGRALYALYDELLALRAMADASTYKKE